MRSKILSSAKFRVVGIMDGESCPVEDFLVQGEAATEASRSGLIKMITYVAEHGLQGCPSAWFHEADKKKEIYEFVKGDLRLFFFKGQNGDVAVCTSGVLKKGQKADKSAVNYAYSWRLKYDQAIKDNTYEVIDDEDQ